MKQRAYTDEDKLFALEEAAQRLDKLRLEVSEIAWLIEEFFPRHATKLNLAARGVEGVRANLWKRFDAKRTVFRKLVRLRAAQRERRRKERVRREEAQRRRWRRRRS